jgi:hypothetical protein
VRGSSSRIRWKRPDGIIPLVALLACVLALPCGAADGYLNRSKAQEANPYGTTIEPPTSHERTQAIDKPDGNHPHHTGPPSGTTSSTVQPESTQGGRGGRTSHASRPDQGAAGATPIGSADEGSSEQLRAACASGEACGGRMSNGRS